MKPVIIGDAQLYLGDCVEILPLIGKVDAVITDPPYGISYVGKAGRLGSREKKVNSKNWNPIIGDDKPFDPSLLLNYETVLMFGANHYASRLPQDGKWLVWVKRDRGVSNSHADCEIAWINKKGPARVFQHLWMGVCRDSEAGEEVLHPTQKPVAVMAWCIEQAGKPEVILDPFMGSGTTGVAAIQLGCKFVGIERDPAYFDVACKRIERAVSQGKLFAPEPVKQVQESFL